MLEAPAQHFRYDLSPNPTPTPVKTLKSTLKQYNPSPTVDQYKHIPDIGEDSGIYVTGLKTHYEHIEGTCCKPTKPSNRGNFRSIALLASLTAVDPDWRDYIGWIPFYNMTQVSNNHIDIGSDCTHMIYTPFYLDPIYQAIESEIMRLAY